VVPLERTAYPQFARCYRPKDLEHTFTPDEDEVAWIKANGRSASGRLGLAVLLKSFPLLWYFPAMASIPPEIVNHIRGCPHRLCFLPRRQCRGARRHDTK
jgi:hypothetical protein